MSSTPIELPDPPAVAHLRKVLAMDSIPTGVIVAAARDVLTAYDFERERLRSQFSRLPVE